MRGSHLIPLALVLALQAPCAGAEIYRCVGYKGRPLYTDAPCDAGAQPVKLQLPQTTAADASVDLAKSHDERLGRERQQRDKADASWLKTHDEQTTDEARLRKALVEGRVVQGMSAAQVRQVWGEPDDADHSIVGGKTRERWVWREGKRRKTVSFEDGKVRGMSGGGRSEKVAGE